MLLEKPAAAQGTPDEGRKKMAVEKWTSYRNESKEDFGGNHEVGFRPCDTQIAIGCLARIADATEKMAGNYTALQNDRDYYKRRCEERGKEMARLGNVIGGLRGALTRAKNK